MEEIIVEAIERITKTGKAKEVGFIPGVLYGDEIPKGVAVKFEEKPLLKALSGHGISAKLNVRYQGDVKIGFIKEVQRQPLSGMIVHMDIQVVSREHEVNRQIPISFIGEEELKKGFLETHINKADVHVFGKMHFMPETIEVNVADLKLNDTITYESFHLDPSLKNSDHENQIYAMITVIKNQLMDTEDLATAVK